jgi:hypothetical protein
MDKKEEKAIWLGFANTAVRSYEIPDHVDSLDELVDDLSKTCGLIADAMLDEFEDRFGQKEREDRRRPRRGEPETD